MRSWLVVFSLAGLLVSTDTSAQTPQLAPVAAFSDLAALLPPGTTIVVTDTKGRHVKGKLSGLSGESLSLAMDGRIQKFTRPEIWEVRKVIPDTIVNGGLIGLAAGFVLPAVICTSRSDASETVSCVAGAFALGGLPGLGIGLGIDAMRSRKVMLFRSSSGTPHAFTVTPVVTPGRIELRASVRLGKTGGRESRRRR